MTLRLLALGTKGRRLPRRLSLAGATSPWRCCVAPSPPPPSELLAAEGPDCTALVAKVHGLRARRTRTHVRPPSCTLVRSGHSENKKHKSHTVSQA